MDRAPHAPAVPAPPTPRRTPKQRRSREIVDAIVAAGRLLLEEGGPAALTTNHIAERAGVSVGSLYRYFSNKEAILAAIYEADAAREASELVGEERVLEERPLEEALTAVVDFQLERHRRLLEMEGDFYRDHHRSFSLTRRLGPESVEAGILRMLRAHADQLRVRDLDQAAFLIAFGISAVLRMAVDTRPQKLYEPAFRQELLDLVQRYVAR